jgi:hypothetical protein
MKTQWWVLALIIGLLFWVRLELATSTPSYSYDSYLTLRSVSHIQETGTPLREDVLSITGAKRITNPVFDYILAMAALVSPIMYKIIPNLCMVLLLIPVYFLAFRMTKSDTMALVAVILAGTSPIAISSYLITPGSGALAALVFLTIIALFYDPASNVSIIVTLAILLTFISPIIFLLALSLLAIIVLLRIEGFGVDRRVGEMFFFTLLLAVWFYVIVYKQALFSQGIAVIWQNLPSEFSSHSFRSLTFLEMINGLGVVTFLLGAIGVYHALFEKRERSTYAIIGAVIAVTTMLLVRVIPLQLGLLLLSLLLAVMASFGLFTSLEYLHRTKAPGVRYPFLVVALLLLTFSSVLPALVSARMAIDASPSSSEISSYMQLSGLPADAVLLTSVEEGAAVQYYSNRTTLADLDFLLVPNGDELIKDIDSVYTSHFSAPVVTRAEKLGFTHILLTPMLKEQYNRTSLFSEGPCLPKKNFQDIAVYEVICGVQE